MSQKSTLVINFFPIIETYSPSNFIKDCSSELVRNMASLMIAVEKNIWLLWSKHTGDEAKELICHRI